MLGVRGTPVHEPTSKPILLVDDDAAIRESLAELLEEEGYRVTSVANGIDALRLLREGARPRVILLDLMMPLMDGWQFRIEQKKDPELAKIPVLVLTAARTAARAPVDAEGVIKKPIDFPSLLEAIRQVT